MPSLGLFNILGKSLPGPSYPVAGTPAVLTSNVAQSSGSGSVISVFMDRPMKITGNVVPQFTVEINGTAITGPLTVSMAPGMSNTVLLLSFPDVVKKTDVLTWKFDPTGSGTITQIAKPFTSLGGNVNTVVNAVDAWTDGKGNVWVDANTKNWTTK